MDRNDVVGLVILGIVMITIIGILVVSLSFVDESHIKLRQEEKCYSLGMVSVETQVGLRCAFIKDLVK